MKTGILLVNLGTPDSPATGDVRKYLREFLMDKRVIDIPYLNRFLLINMIIAPFRAPKSAKVYKELWTERGSPLLFHGLDLKDALQNEMGSEYIVEFGMRYQSPSIEGALMRLKEKNPARIIIVPLFPQYASASTGSALELCMDIIKKWEVIPDIVSIAQFLQHPDFIRAFEVLGRSYMEKENYDHFIFSYHGLPERQIVKASVGDQCKIGSCCHAFHERNRFCYRAQCFETTRLLADALQLKPEQYSICFQSRLGKTPWIQPYAEDVIKKTAAAGHKKVLFFSPSFVADCLETTIEGGEEYKELFLHHGGEKWDLVQSLNVTPHWVSGLKQIILDQIKK